MGTSRLEAQWYQGGALSVMLLPLAWLFCLLATLRRLLYRAGWLRTHRLPVPVIIVGNVTVGGTGKTPLVIALARLLQARGRRPGIISRGYGGGSKAWPRRVTAGSDPAEVGDEPVLIAGRSGCPVVVGPDRVAAAERLLAEFDVDIILSDDGMQHYRLGRDREIAVLDAARGLGNGRCLPAGPLRERPGRLRQVDAVVTNGVPGEEGYTLSGDTLVAVDGTGRVPVSDFRGRRVHAVAGIGHPQRFFATLRQQGLEVIEHPLPDHHPIRPTDVQFGDELPVVMTEKDAVKCRAFGGAGLWYLPVEARLSPGLAERLLALMEGPG